MIGTLIFYNSIILLSTFFVYLSERVRGKGGAFILSSIAFLIVWLPSAFRYGIGTDYFTYVDMYESISYYEDIEIGYRWLNEILLYFDLSSDWLFIVTSFVTYFCFFISYPKNNKALSHFLLFIIFYLSVFTYVRNGIALGFILIAIMQYVNHRSISRYVFFIAIATLFHKSAIIYLIFLLIFNNILFVFIKNIHRIIIALIITIFVFREQLWLLIVSSGIIDLFGFTIYFDNAYYSKETEYSSGLGALVKILILLFPLMFYKKILNQDRQHYLFIVIIVSCIIANIMASQMHILFRVSYILSFAYIFCIYIICSVPSIPLKRLYFYGSVIFFMAIFNKVIFEGSNDFQDTCIGGRLYPYVSIFNKEDSQRVPELTSHPWQCENYFKNK